MLNFKDFIKTKKLIIVDIQPAYAKNIHFMEQFAQFISKYQEILVLYNGPELGFPSKATIANWYVKNGVSKDIVRNMKWFEKNYAFFRDLMDNQERNILVKLARFMITKNIQDWRELTSKQIKKLDLENIDKDGFSFYIPELAKILKKWNGADIIGGACYECLEEVLILMDALKMNYNIIHDFVYY